MNISINIWRKFKYAILLALRVPQFFFVFKKNNIFRFCVDYRAFNIIIIKNRHPLLLIEETLDRFIGAKTFIKLDLRDVYYRIRIKFNNKWKTAF